MNSLWLIGSVLVLVLGFAVGFAARGDDNRRYHASRDRYWRSVQLGSAPQLVHAVSERTSAPVEVHVHLPGLPQPAPVVGWPQVVDGHVIRELPPVGWGN